jgi:hypothetical protein
VASKKQCTRITQALPDTRVIPRVRFLSEAKNGIPPTGVVVTTEVSNALSRIALSAYAKAREKSVKYYDNKDEPIAVILAPNKAANAASHFVSEKEFEVAPTNFRRLVADTGKSSLKRAAIELLKKMPPDGSPPFPQMRKLTGGGEWRKKLDPALVREALERWVELMGELSGMTGSGRSPIAAEKKFVADLAHYWKEELGATLGNSRSWANKPKEFEQKGLFPNFVRKAAEIIPPGYRPASWDHAIREITERKR